MTRMKATSSGLQHALQFNLDAVPQEYVLQTGKREQWFNRLVKAGL